MGRKSTDSWNSRRRIILQTFLNFSLDCDYNKSLEVNNFFKQKTIVTNLISETNIIV